MNDEYKKMLERFEKICQNAKKELCGKKEKEQEKRFIEKIDKELTISEYDEIEYWLANVEVLDNTDYILNNRKAKILVRYLKEKQQEIERLNELLEDEKLNKEIAQGHKKEVQDIELQERKEIERLNKELENLRKLNDANYKSFIDVNNIINELKWKPIEEYDKGNYDWVLVKYFDKDFECIPCVAEKRFDKWYNRNDELLEFDVKYFMDMQQIDKLQELKGDDKE